MTEGGNLTIETALVNLDENDARRLEDLNPGEHVMLTVSDTGDGMDEETRSQIYEPFFSTKGEQGTGLGLATVHGIVKQHGGHIEVDSELGQGTTFKVYLPVSSYEPISDDAIAEPRTSLMGSETIMLVDDDEPVRLLAETFLKRQGYNVLSAHSGEESLAILDRHREPLHLLLTDVVMPGLNGKELFEKAVERKGNLKVLYMSGYTEDIVTDRGGLDKDTDLIHKPFSINALATKVREILDAE
jgi:CheY-like chemotaxis protein